MPIHLQPFVCRVFVLFVLLVSAQLLRAESVVRIIKDGGRFELVRNGKPYRIQGVGGDTELKLLKTLGGNSVRTWDAKELGKTLNAAQKHQLTVCAGLWMGHPRHGFDYSNSAAVQEQLQQKLNYVKQHKDHPALLIWAVGNEMEEGGHDPKVWQAVNDVAKAIKKIDPNHPTMTVIAEVGDGAFKVRQIQRYCPDIDIIGVNSYGGIETVGQRLLAIGVDKPFIITEHGPLGPWEVGKTAWGSPIEWSSTEKAKFYAKGFTANAKNHVEKCLGTYTFLWGHKQETTATWFGMLLPDGRRLGAADTMSEMWTGRAPENRVPIIKSYAVDRVTGLVPGDVIEATVDVDDPEKDPLEFEWVLKTDSGTIGVGGDRQQTEKAFKKAVTANGKTAQVTIPDTNKPMRLFVYVSDNHRGAAVANVPLGLKIKMKNTPVLPASSLPYVVYGENVPHSVYIPSGYMGNSTAITMDAKSAEKPYSGSTCLKVQYSALDAWGGVLWQSPAEDWDGKLPGGANLTGATDLEFYARGANGGEVVNFVFGVLDGDQPFRDTAKGELKDVRLTSEWKRYTFPLKDLDLRRIKTGFGWSLAGQSKPVTFYLDNIRYVQAN